MRGVRALAARSLTRNTEGHTVAPTAGRLYRREIAGVNALGRSTVCDMLYVLALFLLPPIFVFGIYHLALWIDFLGIRRRKFWRRMALASGVSHLLLVAGFFVFFYVDYQATTGLVGGSVSPDAFLFGQSPFWSLMVVLDTLSMLVLLGVFGMMDRLGIALGGSVPMTAGVIFVIGTVQWYWVGGAIGAAWERLWMGLKGADESDEDPGRNWL